MSGKGRQEGQTTVELALLLPFVLTLALTLVQLALVVRAQILVVHAAREGVRVAAVGAPDPEIRRSTTGATGLDPARMTIVVGHPRPSAVRVEVAYRVPVRIPLVGRLSEGLEVSSAATMMLEGP